jgi:plastocyanin
MNSTKSPLTVNRPRTMGTALRVLGSGLLFAMGAIHLDLFLTGYRHIPTIGTLFFLQVITAFVLALLALALSRRTVALAGAGFALSTLGGYILSLWIGLFGFKEIRTSAGIVAGILEVAAFAALGGYALFFAPAPRDRPPHFQAVSRRALAPLGAIAGLAFVIAVANTPGASSPSGGPTTNSGSATTTSMKISIKNFQFYPPTFSVAPGATITVTNHDSLAHTLTALPGSTPLGTFDSGNIAPGKSVTVTAPDKPGSYAFYCAIHNYMTGTLVVK